MRYITTITIIINIRCFDHGTRRTLKLHFWDSPYPQPFPALPHHSPPFPPPSPLIINAKTLYKHSWNPIRLQTWVLKVSSLPVCKHVAVCKVSFAAVSKVSPWVPKPVEPGWRWNRRDWDIWDWARSRNTAPLESVKHLVSWQKGRTQHLGCHSSQKNGHGP